MSMISGLIDELNKSADEWNASNMFELARMCRDAADTIWELRDDLQRANAENAKLREELADAPKCETCEAMLDCDECLRADGSHKERRRLSAENAKLREQIHWLMQGDILHVLTDQEYIDQCERERLMQVSIDALDKENAKLRELVRDMWEGYNDPRCEECHLKDTPTCSDCPICAREASVIDRMRDLGVEVDG